MYHPKLRVVDVVQKLLQCNLFETFTSFGDNWFASHTAERRVVDLQL